MAWIIAIHVIFVICWFAGLFYLPRLFVYHASAIDEISIARFKIMERKLLLGIMTPSAIIALVTGLILLYSYAWQAYQNVWWLKAKLICVVLLIMYHFFCWKYYLAFKHDKNLHSHLFYRWFNEVPVLLLIIIIVLVIVKPF